MVSLSIFLEIGTFGRVPANKRVCPTGNQPCSCTHLQCKYGSTSPTSRFILSPGLRGKDNVSYQVTHILHLLSQVCVTLQHVGLSPHHCWLFISPVRIKLLTDSSKFFSTCFNFCRQCRPTPSFILLLLIFEYLSQLRYCFRKCGLWAAGWLSG